MTQGTRALLDFLQSVRELPGARGALLATGDGAYAEGRHSNLELTVANDVAKTVRRMVVASTTVGAPLEELVINLGAARMMVRPLDEDTTLVILLERHTQSAPIRDAVGPLLTGLTDRLAQHESAPGTRPPAHAESALDNPDDELAALVGGELGPVLREIETSFSGYVQRLGGDAGGAANIMREQLREWLLCCNPSPYTLPLLLDGLSQTLNDDPAARADFMTQMQQILKNSGVWQGTSA